MGGNRPPAASHEMTQKSSTIPHSGLTDLLRKTVLVEAETSLPARIKNAHGVTSIARNRIQPKTVT